MPATGWMGEAPDAEGPAMPLTEMLLANRERRAGPMETALARSRAAEAREEREQAADARDPDEAAAALIARGYVPGMASQLALRLGDTMAELEAERDKIERGERRQEHVRRMHQNGQIRAWDIPQLLDGDFGDPGRVSQLERQAESLRRQCGEAQQAIAPPQAQRSADPLEDATRRAHATFREVTRQRMAEAQQSRPQARPPFDSIASAGAGAAEHTGPDCEVCATARRREAARDAAMTGEYKVPPGSEYIGPAITRTLRADGNGVYGNHAQPEMEIHR
jgi:hypothetical protein